jgi:hypothetical protein
MKSVAPTVPSPSRREPVVATSTAASTRLLATVLLAAGVCAVCVVTDSLMQGWADAHLLSANMVLWGLAVLAIVLLRGLTRALAHKLMVRLDAWSAQLAHRRAEQRLWEMVQNDPRMRRDLEVAMGRAAAKHTVVRHPENRILQRAAHWLRHRLGCMGGAWRGVSRRVQRRDAK